MTADSNMLVEDLSLGGMKLIKPRIFDDQRGYFYELHAQQRYSEAGMPSFVQDNVSLSRRGVLRGLHLQSPRVQGKLVYVLRGAVFDVAVDLRRGSPTYKQWLSLELSETNHHQLYIPAGFAHGFCALTDEVVLSYKCTDYYAPESELGVRYDDPQLGIDWPVELPIMSTKDRDLPTLAQIEHKLPEI